MIVLIISLIFYIVDPTLGIILAITLPGAIALDSTGEYRQVLVGVMFAVAVYFVRKVGHETLED